MFQNKRRRYSHESRRDTVRCRPLPVSAQCGILGVPKSTYYWMLDHPETERTDPHEEDVGRVWRDSGRVYGAGRIEGRPGT